MFPFLYTKQDNIRGLFLYSFFLIFVTIIMNLCTPLLLKEIVSRLSVPAISMTYSLIVLLISYGLIWTISQTIQQFRQIILVRPMSRCIRIFCSKLLEHLHSLPFDFHLNSKTGHVSGSLERAQQGIPDIFWGLFLFVIPTLIEVFCAGFILSFLYGVKYIIVLAIMTIIFILFTAYATNWASKYQVASNIQKSQANAHIVDSLLNFASVKYFNNIKYEMDRCNDYLLKRDLSLVKSLSSIEIVRIGQRLIIGSGIIVLIFIAGNQVVLSNYDISDFILINGYILQFAAPLGHMGLIIKDIRRGFTELDDILSIYKTKLSDFQIQRDNVQKIEDFHELKFNQVCFGYQKSSSTLKNISFIIKKGKKIAVVGKTGSGKSTLSNLIFNFYEVTSGEITVNDVNINNIEKDSLYNLLGIVPQDVLLFNTSIYENIIYARPDAKKSEVEQAIFLSNLEPVLNKLNNHYHTIVGERGMKLSAGEKQRIAIARILLKKPSIYIFDEATSYLDYTSQRIIMDNIFSHLKNKTVIIIAHRLETIIKADEILVMNEGSISERGRHEYLITQNGLYAEMWGKK